MRPSRLELIPFYGLLPSFETLSKVRNAAVFVLLTFPWAALRLLRFIGSLGFLAFGSHRSGGMIQTDSAARAAEIFGYVFFVLTFIFAIDFANLTIAVTAVGILSMQLVGERLSAYAGVPLRARPFDFGKVVTFSIIDLGLFAALDIVGANPQALPGLQLSSVVNGSFEELLTLSSLITVQIGIAEEVFFRGGAANLGSRYGGPLLGIMTSTVFFFAFHIPAYYPDGLKLGIIAADGAVTAWGDFESGSLASSIFAHVANNIIFVLAGSILGPQAVGL